MNKKKLIYFYILIKIYFTYLALYIKILKILKNLFSYIQLYIKKYIYKKNKK